MFAIRIVPIIETNRVIPPPGMRDTRVRMHAQGKRGNTYTRSCVHHWQSAGFKVNFKKAVSSEVSQREIVIKSND